MKNFIKGVIFISLIIPICGYIVDVLGQISDYVVMHFAVKTEEKRRIIAPIEEEEIHSNVIGFQAPSPEEEYDDNWEDE